MLPLCGLCNAPVACDQGHAGTSLRPLTTSKLIGPGTLRRSSQRELGDDGQRYRAASPCWRFAATPQHRRDTLLLQGRTRFG